MSVTREGSVVAGDDAIMGFLLSPYGREKGRKLYFHSVMSTKSQSSGSWSPGKIIAGETETTGRNTGIYSVFSTSEGEQVKVKVGFSYISSEQARQNLLNEIPAWDFNRVKNNGRERWNEALGKIKIKGGTESERVTVLYGIVPCFWKEDDQRYGIREVLQYL